MRPRLDPNSEPVTVLAKMRPALVKAMDRRAKAEGVNRSEIIRRAVEAALKRKPNRKGAPYAK